MKIETMKARPWSMSSFERNIFYLVENIKQRTLMLPPGFSPRELRKVRKLPNGRVDLLRGREWTSRSKSAAMLSKKQEYRQDR